MGLKGKLLQQCNNKHTRICTRTGVLCAKGAMRAAAACTSSRLTAYWAACLSGAMTHT